MVKSASKKIRRAVSAAFWAAAAAAMMMAAGCQDSNLLMEEKLYDLLVNKSGEGWALVCAMPPEGLGCDPKATRAIAFHGDRTATIYEVAGTSWRRVTQVIWSTDNGDILYVSYSLGTDRYSFRIDNGLLTLRDESDGIGVGFLTEGSLLAGFERKAIGSDPRSSHTVYLATISGGELSVKTPEGTVIENGSAVPPGTEVIITVTPDDGYELSSLTVNGQPFVNGETYTVDGPLTVDATFAVRVNFSHGAGGALSVTTSDGAEITSGAAVDVGTVLNITATPDANYYLSSLTVNGEPAVSGVTYPVDSPVEISAAFLIHRYSVTFASSAGGTLSATAADVEITSDAAINAGTVLTINATPNDGYVLSSLTVNGETFASGANHTVDGATSVIAVFSDPEAPAHPVTFSEGAGGTLSVRTSAGVEITSGTVIDEGTVLTVTATPNTGNTLSSLTVNGRSISSGATHTVDGTVMIAASFSAPVTFTYGANGLLSVTSESGVIMSGDEVPVGTVLTITAAPYAGNDLSSLTVNGLPFTNGGTHTVSGPVEISAEFSIRTYTVTTTSNEGGTLSVSSTDGAIMSGDRVPAGTILTITATPDDDYRVSSLTVNGLPLIGATHTVTNTTTIAAAFAPVTNDDDDGITFPDIGGTIVNGSGGGPINSSWFLDDGSELIHNGMTYANSAVFAPNGRFWQVAIPLYPNGRINENLPAKYMDVGTYIMFGNTVIINIPEAKFRDNVHEEYRGTFIVSVTSGGERSMRITRDTGKIMDFYEIFDVEFEYDATIVDTMLEQNLLD